jgi:hypothetical protein
VESIRLIGGIKPTRLEFFLAAGAQRYQGTAVVTVEELAQGVSRQAVFHF